MSESRQQTLNGIHFTMAMLNAAEEEHEFSWYDQDHRLDVALAAAKVELEQVVRSGGADLNLQFSIFPNHLRNDSSTVRNAISYLRAHDLVRETSNGRMLRFCRGEHQTARKFHVTRKIPGEYDLYRRQLVPGFLSVMQQAELSFVH